MPDGFEVLQTEIRSMSENVAHMRTSIDGMAQELRKVAVLEEKHNGHDAALQRAFTEVKDVEAQLLAHIKSDTKEHDGFKKALWFSTGFAVAVSVLWTVFGLYLGDSVRETFKAVGELRAHVADKTIHVPMEKK